MGFLIVFNIIYELATCSLKVYKVESVPELLEKVQQMGVENVMYESLKDAGVHLGGLAHLWEVGYLSGRKIERSG